MFSKSKLNLKKKKKRKEKKRKISLQIFVFSYENWLNSTKVKHGAKLKAVEREQKPLELGSAMEGNKAIEMTLSLKGKLCLSD